MPEGAEHLFIRQEFNVKVHTEEKIIRHKNGHDLIKNAYFPLTVTQ
jgi:hypothetical protein